MVWRGNWDGVDSAIKFFPNTTNIDNEILLSDIAKGDYLV